MRHPAAPPAVSVPWIVAAASVWLIIALAGPGAVPEVPQGPYEGRAVLVTHVVEGRHGPWALARIDTGTVLADFDERPEATRGDVLEVAGTVTGAPGYATGRAHGGVLEVRRVSRITPSMFLPHRAGRIVAERVMDRLRPYDEGRSLLAGFLVGDTSWVDPVDIEAMRRSGLAHYVAVSGSNVALFLGLLAVVAGPLAMGPRRRAALGLLALPVYAAATRFEPSVMRASVMAGVALGGRLIGVVLETWQLLAVAVVALLFADPGLTSSVGFQLSVVATAGVVVGARWPVEGKLGRALAVTLGAQLAVAPLLLWHFGTVPLLSPVANLVAAPMVAGSTLLAALGVAGPSFLVEPASWLAQLVLLLARGASVWPQLDLTGLAIVLSAFGLIVLWPRLRPLAACAGAVTLFVALVLPGEGATPGSVVVLDVGQGDAILIHGDPGRWVLVDGGPDEVVLLDKLASHGVHALELVVLSHVHADHATGLTGLVGRIPIGRVWTDPQPHETPASREFFDALQAVGIEPVAPRPGDLWDVGLLQIRVDAPMRRYASPNDQSIVLTVTGPGRSMVLAGDIETYAQADLSHLRADVLKVPHQGAATSDPDWLRGVGAELAVISVGPNDFGHPADWVVDLLAERGTVQRTDQSGDVVVDLTSVPESRCLTTTQGC